MTTENDRYMVRPGRAGDACELAELHASVQLQAATGGRPHPGIAAWVEDLLDGHPSVQPDDFLVAEDLATGRAVASLVGLRQDWSLAGVRLPVAQIELVGTSPKHRGNRLTERLFADLHQRHAAEGIPVQIIEGIPYFYRRLGYDYALANDGAPTVPAIAVKANADDERCGGGLTVRPATIADANDLAHIDSRLADGNTLVCPRDADVWRYEIGGRRPSDIARRSVAVLVHNSEVRGYVVYSPRLSAAGELTVVAAACARPADWPQATAAIYEYLGNTGLQQTLADRPFTAIRLLLDPTHPLGLLGPPGVPKRPRGWYARTSDPASLLARLQPLLHDRWQAAELQWHEPAMTIDMYGRAAKLEFTDGKLAAVTATRGVSSPTTDPQTHAAIPPGALLQLALGHRTLPEILDTWPDCVLRDRITEQFLTAAFPRMPTRIWPRN